MNKPILPELKEVLEAVRYRPAISIILPFEPKMNAKSELAHALKTAAARVEQQLLENYPDDTAAPMMQKLNTIIKGLNFDTHKKSIAIFISPVFEKVLYLDIPVEERIIVDESFEIRDLVYSKKQLHKYLVLLLSSKESRTYLGNTTTFIRIHSGTSEAAVAFENDIAERVANFSDMNKRDEVLMEKFLRHIDQSLDMMLHTWHLPLFVMGAERTIGHFKNITRHGAAVIDYIPGNYLELPLPKLKQVLEPYVADWKQVKQKELLNHLEDAAGSRKLATGIQDVWREATNRNGRLLAVEKNFMYPAEHGSGADVITGVNEPYNQFSCIKDAVDDVIEKVLECGGDVEFTDPGVLHNYGSIAMVRFY